MHVDDIGGNSISVENDEGNANSSFVLTHRKARSCDLMTIGERLHDVKNRRGLHNEKGTWPRLKIVFEPS